MKKILSTLFFLFFVVSAQAQSVVVYEGKDVYMPNATLHVGGTITSGGNRSTLFIPAGVGRAGTTAGWVNTGTNLNQATVAASQTSATFTIPIVGLQVGDTIESFKVVAQIESAGNTATLDADLRKLTNAAADPVDASVGAITQVSVTADTAVASSKTLATADVVASGESFYLLLTATTAASTDIRLLGVEVVAKREN